MNSSVLAYLENSAEYFPEKCAVTDEKVSYLNLSHREMQ